MTNQTISILEYTDEDFYYLYSETRPPKGDTCYNTHSHPFYEIVYIHEGTVEYLVENRRHELRAGDVLLVKPGLVHVAKKVLETPSSRTCVGFYLESIENSELAESFFNKGEHFTVGEDSIFAKVLGLLKAKLETSGKNSRSFFKYLMDSMLLMLDEEGLGEEKIAFLTEPGFRRVISYIASNLVSINKIDDIANALFFSPSYLGHLFKREMGIGIMEYVRIKKVILAHEKIMLGAKPTDIYEECGFNNYPSFFRAYRAYFGKSPKSAKTK